MPGVFENNSEQPSNTMEKRVFWHYAKQHLEEMRLLFRGGRLSKKDGDWNNVIDHCLIQGAEVEALARFFIFTKEEQEKLQKTALVHDWQKRLDSEPDQFTEEQINTAGELLNKVLPDPEILASTEKGFSKTIIDGQAS